MPIFVCSCPLTGATSPVTLAGTLVQSNAEFLAGALMVQLTNPGNPVIYATSPVTLNMKTGSPQLAIEYGMMLVGIAKLAKYYGIPSSVYGFGSDSKTLDEQAAFEKVFSLVCAASAGANMITGLGALDTDITQSFEQLLIDCELLGIVRRLLSGISVNEEKLAVDLISKVGPRGQYIKEEHTRKFFREEYFMPELSDKLTRGRWEKEGSKDIVTKAREKVKKLLAEHKAPELPKETLTRMRKVLQKAKEEEAKGAA
jgi:trimethylamine--corrinoid protein Co-methyltransferase